MKKTKTNGWTRMAMSALMVAALGACGGGGSSSSSGSSAGGASSGGTGDTAGAGSVATGDDGAASGIHMTTAYGVAAVGAPLVGGAVQLKCASGATASATAGADGAWSASVPEGAYPCVARVSATLGGGAATVLHSVVAAAGVTNITPLTDLIVGILSGQAPADWFDGASNGTLGGAITASALSDALAKLKTTLATLPGKPELPEGFDPLSSPFSAKKGDVGDDFLESFGAALAASGLTQAQAAGHAAAGEALTQLAHVLKVYTTPNMTAAFGFRGGLSINLDSQIALSITDPLRGPMTTTITPAIGSTALSPTGPFTAGVSPMAGAYGQLCTAGAGAFSSQQHSQYVYVSEDLTEVTDLNELKGVVFDDYEDCQKTGTLSIDFNGSAVYTETGQLPDEPDVDFLAAFTAEGREETSNGVIGVARAKAFKYRDNTGTRYVYLGVSNRKGDASLAFDGDPTYVTMGVSRQFD